MVRAILLAAIFLMVAAMSLVTARYQARDLFIKTNNWSHRKRVECGVATFAARARGVV